MPDDKQHQFTFSRSMGIVEAIAKGQHFLATLRQIPELHQGLPSLSDHLDNLQTAIEALQQDHAATSAGNKTRIPFRESALDQVVDYLNRIGTHVKLATWDNTQAVHSLGFDTVKQKTAPGPLTAPEKFTVKNLDEDGSVTCSSSTVKGAKNYEVSFTGDDPTAETWPTREIFPRATKLRLSELQQGKKYYFRARAISASDERGPWSAIVSLIVT